MVQFINAKENITQLQYEERQIQQKLIQESNTITAEELQILQQRNDAIELQLVERRRHLNELLDLAPFAISGDMLMQVSEQAEKEKQNHSSSPPDQKGKHQKNFENIKEANLIVNQKIEDGSYIDPFARFRN